MNHEYVGDRLDAVIEALGVTEIEIARRFKVSPQAVNGWRRGLTRMHRLHLRHLGRLERDAAKREEVK